MLTESWAAAKPRMTARIGPTQGVQPKAKAKPIRNAPHGVLPPFTLCSRASVYRALILNRPVRCSPKQDDDHTRHLRQHRLVARQQLTHFGGNRAQGNEHNAEAQNEADRVQHDLLSSRDSGAFSSSTPAPEISDT